MKTLKSPRAAVAPRWGNDIHIEPREEAKNTRWTPNFSQLLPDQAIPIPWGPVCRASLFPRILELTQSPRDLKVKLYHQLQRELSESQTPKI